MATAPFALSGTIYKNAKSLTLNVEVKLKEEKTGHKTFDCKCLTIFVILIPDCTQLAKKEVNIHSQTAMEMVADYKASIF